MGLSEDLVFRYLGQALRRLRGARDLTVRELEVASGVSKSTISVIEGGTANPRLDVLVRLAAALRVSPRLLLPGSQVDETPLPWQRVARSLGLSYSDVLELEGLLERSEPADSATTETVLLVWMRHRYDLP